MWIQLFTIGSFGFWLLTAIVALALTTFMRSRSESTFWATASVVLYIVVLNVFGDAGTFEWITTNPLWTAAIAGGYLLLGVFISVVKWEWFVSDARDLVQDQMLNVKNEFRRQYEMDTKTSADDRPFDEKIKPKFQTWLKAHYAPKVREHKQRVINWMVFWPFVTLGMLFDDILRRMFASIYKTIQNYLQRRSDRAFETLQD